MPVTVKITASDIDDDEPGVKVEIMADGESAAQEACDAFQTVCDRMGMGAYIDGDQKTEATPAEDKPPV